LVCIYISPTLPIFVYFAEQLLKEFEQKMDQDILKGAICVQKINLMSRQALSDRIFQNRINAESHSGKYMIDRIISM
jgi:hypothetical protein